LNTLYLSKTNAENKDTPIKNVREGLGEGLDLEVCTKVGRILYMLYAIITAIHGRI